MTMWNIETAPRPSPWGEGGPAKAGSDEGTASTKPNVFGNCKVIPLISLETRPIMDAFQSSFPPRGSHGRYRARKS